MRFGKRLTELTQNGQSDQPYISYKELKHTLGELPRLIASCTGAAPTSMDAADSSGDEAPPDTSASSVLLPAASSRFSSPSKEASARARLEEQQRSFFERIANDVSMALSHVQSSIAAQEAAVGDWQCKAASCGLLYTPAQIEEVVSHLPFKIAGEQALVQWLAALQPLDSVRPARLALAENYGQISNTLQVLLQYIEVNITAVRKIFKKFEKKVPADFRTQSTLRFTAHHDLFTSGLQDLLVTVVHMHRLTMNAMTAFDMDIEVRNSLASPISFLGPESRQVLQRVKVSKELCDLITGLTTLALGDAYAKPNSSNAPRGGNGGGDAKNKQAAILSIPVIDAAPKQGLDSMSLLSQQVAVNLRDAEMFQGPPKTSPGQANPIGAPAKTVSAPFQTNNSNAGWFNKAADKTADKNAACGQKGGQPGLGGQAAPKAARARGGKGKGRGSRGNMGQPAQGQASQGGRGQQGGNFKNSSKGGYKPMNGASVPDSTLAPTLTLPDVLHHTNGQNDGFGQMQPNGQGQNPNANNIQCMFMMVPANWNQLPARPPGSFNGNAGNGGYQAMAMPQNVDPNMMNVWRGMMAQQFNTNGGQQYDEGWQ